MKSIVYLATGAAFSAAIIVACSDDSPQDADAAVCDCPAAEAPVTAARIVRVDDLRTAAANTIQEPIAACPAGALLLSGSCYIDLDNTAREISLRWSGSEPTEANMTARFWRCSFDNKSTTATATVRAQALCLIPAS